MKINWFSPLPPARVESARFTAELLPLLAERAEINVWSAELHWDSALEKHATVRSYDVTKPLPWREINRAEVSVFQLGDDVRFYGPVSAISRLHPGIVILHQTQLQHLAAGLVAEQWMTQREYMTLAEFHHPGIGRALTASYLRNAISLEELAEKCSLVGLATENALVVAVHSQAAFDDLTKATSVPLACLRFEANGQREAYVDALLELVGHVSEYERIWSARVMSRRVGGALDQLCAESDAPYLLPRIAQEIEILHGASEQLAGSEVIR